VAVAVQKRV